MRAMPILILFASLLSTASFALKVGETAPAFSLKDVDGKDRSLKDFKDKYIVLEWYNKDCPYVRKHYDSKNMQNLQKEFATKVAWLQINSSASGKQGYLEPAAAKKQAETEGVTAAALLQDPTGKVGKLYGAQTTPHMYIIDPKGKLIYMGAIDNNDSPNKEVIANSNNYVRTALNESMAGKTVSTPTTKAYGCGVKYAN